MPAQQTRTDAILPMIDIFMQQILRREKTHEFRRFRVAPSVQRVWFYITAPHKHVAYAAEVDPPTTRNALAPLPDGGAGNREFNAGRYPHGKYAYRIRSVRRVREPVSLKDLRTTYGVASVPRGVLYVPDTFLQNVKWEEQEEIWNDISECTTAENSRAVEKPLNMTTVDSESLASGFQEAQGLCLASEQTREGQDIVNNKRKASDEDGEQACSSRKKPTLDASTSEC